MSRKKVSVSIVTFNNAGFIGDCLRALRDQSYPEIEVVAVDNASADGTPELVAERFPEVRLIRNPENCYFARGQNIGIRNSSGEYIIALNSDVVVEKDFVAEMVKAAEADDRVGSVSGKILRAGGELIDTAGLVLGRDRRPLDIGYGEKDEGQYDTPGYIFGPGGAAPLYRRAMIEDVAVEGEYFDETYGLFYEDLDLAWRAHRRGWLSYYAPKAVAYHKRGASARGAKTKFFSGYAFSSLNDKIKGMYLRNRYMTMIKNDRLLDFVINLPSVLFYDIKVWIYVLLFAPGAAAEFFRGRGVFSTAWRRRKLR